MENCQIKQKSANLCLSILLIIFITSVTLPFSSQLSNQLILLTVSGILFFTGSLFYDQTNRSSRNILKYFVILYLITSLANTLIPYFGTEGQSIIGLSKNLQLWITNLIFPKTDVTKLINFIPLCFCWCFLLNDFLLKKRISDKIYFCINICFLTTSVLLTPFVLRLPLAVGPAIMLYPFYAFGRKETRNKGALSWLSLPVFVGCLFIQSYIKTAIFLRLIILIESFSCIALLSWISKVLCSFQNPSNNQIAASWLEDSTWPIIFLSMHLIDSFFGMWWKQYFASPYIQFAARIIILFAATDIAFTLHNQYKKYRICHADAYHSLLTRITAKMWNYADNSEWFFYFLFGICYFVKFFETTMFSALRQSWTPLILAMGAATTLLIIYALQEIMSAKDQKHFCIDLGILVLGFILWQTNNFFDLFLICILIVAMQHKSMRKILSITLWIGIPMMLISAIAAKTGYIINVPHGETGNAWGIIYATDCAAHWLYLFMAWAILRKGKFHWLEYPLYFLLFYWLYQLTNADTGYICLNLFLLLCLIIQIISCIQKKRAKKHIPLWMLHFSHIFDYSFPLAAVFSILVILFDKLIGMPNVIKQQFSLYERIRLSEVGFETYPITLFGQQVIEHGNGITPDWVTQQYFFLDNSYIKILLNYGLAFLTIMFILMTSLQKKARKERQHVLYAALIITALDCVIEHHLAEFNYNVFLLFPLIVTFSEKQV